MTMEQANQRENEESLTKIHRVFYFALPTLLIIGALIAYKSSAALAVIGRVSATGVFTPRGNVIPQVGGSRASVLTLTLSYFLVIWPALFFGILRCPGTPDRRPCNQSSFPPHDHEIDKLESGGRGCSFGLGDSSSQRDTRELVQKLGLPQDQHWNQKAVGQVTLIAGTSNIDELNPIHLLHLFLLCSLF